MRLSHWLPKNRLQLLRRGAARIAQVDLVVLALEFFSCGVYEVMHALDGRSLF